MAEVPGADGQERRHDGRKGVGARTRLCWLGAGGERYLVTGARDEDDEDNPEKPVHVYTPPGRTVPARSHRSNHRAESGMLIAAPPGQWE